MSLPILTLYKLHYIAYNPIFIIFKTPQPQNLQNISQWQESDSASSGGKRIRWFRVVKKLASNWEMNRLSYPRLSKQQKRSFSDLSDLWLVACWFLVVKDIIRYHTFPVQDQMCTETCRVYDFSIPSFFVQNLILAFQQTLRKLYLNLPIQDFRSQQSLSCSPRGSNYHHLSTMFSTETRSFSPLKARWCP